MEELSNKALAPSLLSLCLDAVADRLISDNAAAGGGVGRTGSSGGCSGGGGLAGFSEDDGGEADEDRLHPQELAEGLPWELLHRLASRLPPVVLESLHHAAHARYCSAETTSGLGVQDGERRGVKRSRCEDFNSTWQLLFKLRWPLGGNTGHNNLVTVDWQQKYWEKHLQESLRLQGVLCTAETYVSAKLLIRLVATMQAGKINVHKNYIRPRETLLSLEFIHCQLYPTVMDKICMSVYLKGSQSHGIQQFSIKSSQICETKPLTISSGLFKILSSGKSLHLLSLRDIKMQSPFARMIIHTLLESSCDLHTLEISENNIAGWLSELNKCSTNLLALKSDIFMNSLSVLNLRENNLQKDDVVDLHKILIKMPNLRDLDISGNPVMDEGIRSLIPFISWSIQKENPLLRLTVENCELSSIGVIILLECLTNAKQLLDVLSIADNHLGSSVAAALARFLGSHVRALNATDIGLGTVGFQILEETLPTEVALSHINISKNRGGIRAAYFVSRLICRAPDLVSVNAAGNLLPPESLEVICNSLKQGTCNLERVDLTGNMHLSSNIFPAFLEFKKHGKPILVVPPNLSTSAPYDDDP
ncbi:RNI-like superfamily protein [Zea mays]|uniref:RNI-like superfamily protein n=1 Tax=Zea mays TaxID=4577 RepID=A0A1D6MUQ6_MAIZE|nr:RNI-like superfamily protein [Zea mays]